MNRFMLGAVGVALGVALGYWIVASQSAGMAKRKLDPAEDPRNAIVPPEKIHPVTADMVSATEKLTKTKAPDFTLPADDGKTYNLEDLARTKPVLLFFIVDSCPCCVTARPYIDRVQNAYRGSLTVLGVINADASVARLWARNNSASFPLLLDPSKEQLHAYNAKRGTYMALIAPGGRIEKVFPGYSQSLIKELGDRIALLAGVPVRPIEVADLPVKATTGCEFDLAR